jgi:integration host factor subunit beta
MSKARLVEVLNEQFAEIGKPALEKIVKAVFAEIIKEVKTSVLGRFVIPGFGTFSTKITQPYLARNPGTGESVEVPAKSGIRFKPAKALVQRDKTAR